MSYAATKAARVFGVLRDFHLFDLLTKRGAITRAVLAYNSNFLCSLRLYETKRRRQSTASFESSMCLKQTHSSTVQVCYGAKESHAHPQRRWMDSVVGG